MSGVFYDPAFAEVRTREVLLAIEPLIRTVHELPYLLDNANRTAPQRSGQELVEVFNYELHVFLQMSKEAVAECPILSSLPDLLEELRGAVNDCESVGIHFSQTAAEFVRNSADPRMRQEVIKTGEEMIRAMAYLLIRSDLIDVYNISDRIEKLRGCAQNMKQSDSNKMVDDYYQQMCVEIEVLNELTRTRVKDLRYPNERDDLRAAFAEIKATAPVYYAATKAFVRHPDQHSAQNLRDRAYRDVDEALVNYAQIAADGAHQAAANEKRHEASLAYALDNFQNRVMVMDPMRYQRKDRNELENLLEDIIKKAGRVAEEPTTRDERKELIMNSTNKLRQGLQDLLRQYESNSPNEEELDLQEVLVNREIKDLRRRLRRAVVDAVSDAFLDCRTPLQVMIRAAEEGDVDGFDDTKAFFSDHAHRMLHAAELVCEMSSDERGNQMIRYACEYIRRLEPQVISAAALLLSQPDSKIAQENMAMFKMTWLEKVRQLTAAVDATINVDDFIAVSEKHIEKDVEEGLTAIYGQNRDLVDRMAGAIRGRALRICDVVEGEFAELSVSPYFEDIKMATKKLRMDALGTFADRAEQVIRKIPLSPEDDPDMDMQTIGDEMIEACALVGDAVMDIRHAILKSRNLDDVDSDNEYEEDCATTMAPSHVSDGDNQQKLLRRLPEEYKEKIQEKIESFKITQQKFESEVAKWDENRNDLIAIAKHMCHLLENMADYTRGRGPYRTTRNVIDAAQEISTAGKKLITLAKQIVDDCVESATKKDLYGYLEQIDMLSTQLNITSKVKADIEIRGDEVIVGNLDSITQLIQNAKNLLQAVVKTVNCTYIASTKCYKRSGPMKDEAIGLPSYAVQSYESSNEHVPTKGYEQ
uniref:Vinculin n=1 Tax=Steinernema glaseri TaxID=37863 RepID=A0A1I7Z8A7_9BILA